MRLTLHHHQHRHIILTHVKKLNKLFIKLKTNFNLTNVLLQKIARHFEVPINVKVSKFYEEYENNLCIQCSLIGILSENSANHKHDIFVSSKFEKNQIFPVNIFRLCFIRFSNCLLAISKGR